MIYFLPYFKRHLRLVYLIFAFSYFYSPLCAQTSHTKSFLSLADSNEVGTLNLHTLEGWGFSFQKPSEIKKRKNLENTIPVSLTDLSDVKSLPEWDNYGWLEIAFEVDSAMVDEPWVLSYGSVEAANIWLNGELVVQAGNPSEDPANETLSRFLNQIQTGIMFREGTNYLLIEFSSHNKSEFFTWHHRLDEGLYLRIFPNYETFLRRQRAFVFGGTLMLLLLLAVIHLYLALKFQGEYHTFVCLTTVSLLLHALVTMSDTLIDWTYSYVWIYEHVSAVAFIFVVYFFLIAIRKIFDLEVHWKPLTSTLVVSVALALFSIYTTRVYLDILHPVLLILTLVYGSYSLVEAKRKSSDAKITIIALGLLVTMTGAMLYVLVYTAFNYNSIALFLFSILLAYTGIPMALTFNVALGYASLIGTLETKVRERTTQLETSNEYQKRFFANISHEFRTPLTISEGLITKVIRKDDLNQIDTKSDLAVVKRNMARLHDMVDQIIDLTKSEQNHLALHQDYYKADNLAVISVESFRSLAEYHGHTFRFYAGAGDAALYVDRLKVEVIINNLLSNAIKFTPDGGTIDIKTETESGQFILTVHDSGPGIPAGKEEVIFERFHRLSRPEEEYVEGMGVGLELSKVLAELHKGDILAKSGVEKGALFQLRMPLVDEEEYKLVEIMAVDEELSYLTKDDAYTKDGQDNFDILLVEDNEDMTQYVSGILSDLGKVATARNGKEALQLLSRYEPDIIITDLMMPVMGGQKLIETLLENKTWANIPVIVLSAKALEDDKLHLLRIGVVDYITKPFLPEQLLLKTRNLLTFYTRRKRLHIDVAVDMMVATEERLSEKAAAFILKNISDSSMSVDILADEFAQSRSSMYRNIQLETGMSPAEFIREVRLNAARKIVAKNKNIRLEELSNAVGYKSATSFRKKYEERFGVHPLG